MSDTTVSFDEAVAQRAPADARDRSTIDFPYLSLDTAVEVAKAVYSRAGLGSCELDELAAEMGQTVSGAFRLKTATAKTFGLVEKEGRSSFRLSELGQRIVQTDREAEARTGAFLAVPLYRAVFERYRGHLLPSAKALEREMGALGVARKQTDKARQAFERSARESGFFAQGEDRLIQPRFDRDLKPPPIEPADAAVRKNGSGGGGGDSDLDLDPLLKALLHKIPPTAAGWPKDQRLRWFRTFAMNVSQVYDDTETVDLKIILQKTEDLDG